MSVLSHTGRPLLRPDNRSGADFSETVLCEAACQAIVDSLFGAGALVPASRDGRRD